MADGDDPDLTTYPGTIWSGSTRHCVCPGICRVDHKKAFTTLTDAQTWMVIIGKFRKIPSPPSLIGMTTGILRLLEATLYKRRTFWLVCPTKNHQTAHPPISLSCPHGYPKCAQRRFWSDCACAVWSESSLGAHSQGTLSDVAAQTISFIVLGDTLLMMRRKKYLPNPSSLVYLRFILVYLFVHLLV